MLSSISKARMHIYIEPKVQRRGLMVTGAEGESLGQEMQSRANRNSLTSFQGFPDP